jgi:hypothetical protein
LKELIRQFSAAPTASAASEKREARPSDKASEVTTKGPKPSAKQTKTDTIFNVGGGGAAPKGMSQEDRASAAKLSTGEFSENDVRSAVNAQDWLQRTSNDIEKNTSGSEVKGANRARLTKKYPAAVKALVDAGLGGQLQGGAFREDQVKGVDAALKLGIPAKTLKHILSLGKN